jgi:N6-adenosine-specific RNA methylase IME4
VGRWELRDSVKDADLVLVLTVETKKVEKIQLKSLEEPHVTQPDDEFEIRTLSARTRAGRELVSFSTRPGWTAARDANDLIQKFKELIQKAEKTSAK